MSDTIEPVEHQRNYEIPGWSNADAINARDATIREQAAKIAQLTAALSTCVWALRQPLDGWKGECERKALDKARDALKEQR